MGIGVGKGAAVGVTWLRGEDPAFAVGEPWREDSTEGTTVTSPRYPNPTPVTVKMTAVSVRCNQVSQLALVIAHLPALADLPDLLKAVSARLAWWAHIH